MPPVAMTYPGSGARSNAAKSKDAKDATAAATEAEKGLKENDATSHWAAGDAHQQAAWKNRDAGNGTKADFHTKQANVFNEKANLYSRAKDFANDMSTSANTLSQKAEKRAFGPDDKDPRTVGELNQDAAEAHNRAAQAHTLAGSKRDASYHQAKAQAHELLGKAPAAPAA